MTKLLFVYVCFSCVLKLQFTMIMIIVGLGLIVDDLIGED